MWFHEAVFTPQYLSTLHKTYTSEAKRHNVGTWGVVDLRDIGDSNGRLVFGCRTFAQLVGLQAISTD